MTRASNQYSMHKISQDIAHFNVPICQMELQVMEQVMAFSYIIDEYSCLKIFFFNKLSDCVSKQGTYFGISTCQM